MRIKKILVTSAFITALANFSASANPSFPESCFQSKADYEVYLVWGNNHPFNHWHDRYLHPYGLSKEQWEQAKKAEEAVKNGPAKWKSINIITKEVTVNGKPYMDASESTTPSGQKDYFWQAVDSRGIIDTTSKFPLTPAGSEFLFNLTVYDPVCDMETTKQLKLHIY